MKRFWLVLAGLATTSVAVVAVAFAAGNGTDARMYRRFTGSRSPKNTGNGN